MRRVKVCECERTGVWICGECSVGVEASDDLFRREQQQVIRPGRANDVEICWGVNHRYGSNGEEEEVGEAQRRQQQRGEDMVVVCSWCEGLVGGEFPPS